MAVGLDFQRIFESAPGLYLILLPDAPRYTIVAASDAYLEATATTREALLGRGLFESESAASRASLDRVVAERVAGAQDTPVLDERGELTHIVHRVEDPRALELQLRALFDWMPQLGWTARPDGFIDFYNRGWYEYTGTTLEEMRGWGWQKVHDPALLPEVLARWQRSLEDGAPLEMEFPLRRHDGAFRWFLTRVTPMRDAEGRLVRWVGINTDIHDRRLARASAEARLGLLVDSIRDYALFMLDLQGTITTWNSGGERLYGYRSDEVVGRHFALFYPEEDVRGGKCEREIEEAGHIGRLEDEGWRVRKDGSRFWANAVLTAVRDERRQLVGFAKVTRDLTERKRAEEERLALMREQQARTAAEAAEERFRVLAEASAILASSLDYEATVRSVARIMVPNHADWCGVEILENGRLVQVAVAHVDPAKVELARELQRRWPSDPNAATGTPNLLRTGKSELYEQIPEEMLTMAARDEDHLRVIRELGLRSALSVPINARGTTIGALSLVWAESGRNYSRDDLPLIEELGRRVGFAIDNARLYRDAQNAIRLRDEFLAIVSHELRTPLTTLQLHASGLLRSWSKLGPEKLVARAAVVDRQVERLSKLVNGLLDVSRASTGRLQLELQTLDLAEVLRDTVDRLKDELAASHCTLELKIAGPMVGRWDPLRLDQIFTNLFTNAMKYGAGKPIGVALELRDERAILTVRDHGIGVGSADHARIFERFGRAVSPEHYGGLGLGLWIVKELAEAMGGRVRVESELGDGALFTVELPRIA